MKFTVLFRDDERWGAPPARVFVVEAETVVEAFWKAFDAAGYDTLHVMLPHSRGQRVQLSDVAADIAPYDPEYDFSTDETKYVFVATSTKGDTNGL